jgi:hypothetical protein
MPGSDRAFRALAHAEPQLVVATLRALCPALLAPDERVTPDDLEPTKLEALAPPREADWVARLGGGGRRLHVECQGYGEGAFVDRLVRYHLTLVLRAWPQPVHTVALWLTRPPPAQRAGGLRHGQVRVEVEQVLVPEVPAERLLADAATACFAPAAAPGALGVEGLCLRAAELLQAAGASWYRWHMAVVCAATQGRYDAMLRAMGQVGVERIVIEDLVNFGRDRGLEQGREQGLALLVRLVERRLGRALSEGEHAELRPRLARLGPERLGDVVLDLEPSALAAWLTDPNAT